MLQYSGNSFEPVVNVTKASYNIDSTNITIGYTFNISDAAFYQEGSTNSGWGGQVGVIKNFKSVSFYVRPWDSNSLMTQVRCLVKIGDYTGTVLADKTISVSVTALTPQKITVTFDSVILNSDNDVLWVDFKCNGKTGCFSKLTPGAIPATRIYQGNSLTTSGINVTSNNEKLIWFEFSGPGIGGSFTNEFKTQLKSNLGLPQFISLENVFTANVNIPSEIFAVEGSELNIYFDNVIWSPLPLSFFEIDVTCTEGKQYDKGWRITPVLADAGTYSFTLTVKINGYTIASKTSTLNVVALTSGTGVTRKLLIIGDSTTAAGDVTDELAVLFTGDDMTLTLTGTQGGGTHEGHSGKTINWAYTDPTSPFVFSGVFDFAQYLSNNSLSLSSGDWVVINYGINDLNNQPNGLTDSQAITKIASMQSDLDAMIANIKSAVSGIRIGVCMTILPAYTQRPFGQTYNSSQQRLNYKRHINYWHQNIINYYDTPAQKAANTFVIPIHTNLDTENNMQTGSTTINARNSTSITVQTDAIHPDTIGYYQISDAYFPFIKVKA